MNLIKKQDINYLDFKFICGLTQLELENWCKQEKLPIYHQWLLPQLVAYFGSWELQYQGEKIDILQTLKHNIGSDPKPLALWRLSRLQRSLLLDLQAKNPDYAQLTPLVLMGFKRYQNIPYEQWRGLEHLEHILEPKLMEALVIDDLSFCDLGSERLLEIRNQGLMNKSGKNAGQLKQADSTWSLTGIQNTEIGHLPKLTQTILCQIWMAHPTKRTQYMLLDFKNWDNQPPPLVSGEIFLPIGRPERNNNIKQKLLAETTFNLPWL